MVSQGIHEAVRKFNPVGPKLLLQDLVFSFVPWLEARRPACLLRSINTKLLKPRHAEFVQRTPSEVQDLLPIDPETRPA